MEYEFRAARPGEEGRIMEIICQARELMHEEGRVQWTEAYPAMSHILGDISRQEGWVIVAKAFPSESCCGAVVGTDDGAAACPDDGFAAGSRDNCAAAGTDDKNTAETIIAYAAVVFTGEPVYNHIEGGEWISDLPYVVVHRLAVAREARRQGVAARFMQEVRGLALSRGVHSFRVDTNYDNAYMLKVLSHLDFTFCGTVYYPQGSRLAFEKLI